MKVSFLHFLAFVSLVAAMSVSSNAYCQTASKAPAIDREFIAAKWQTGNDVYVFNTNHTSEVILSGRSCPTTWTVEGNTITINPKKYNWKHADPCGKVRTFEVKRLTEDDMVVINADKQELHLTRQK